jgi:hypothetical protein
MLLVNVPKPANGGFVGEKQGLEEQQLLVGFKFQYPE